MVSALSIEPRAFVNNQGRVWESLRPKADLTLIARQRTQLERLRGDYLQSKLGKLLIACDSNNATTWRGEAE